jgi:hydrogenase/urease accessory protein HupE
MAKTPRPVYANAVRAQLAPQFTCADVSHSPERPAVCAGFQQPREPFERPPKWIAGSIALVALTLLQSPALDAHSAPFSYLDLKLAPAGIEGTLVVHDFDAAHDLGVADPSRLHEAGFAAGYRDILTRLMASRLSITADGQALPIEWTSFETLPDRQSLRMGLRLGGTAEAVMRVEALLFPYDPVHQTFVNIYEDSTLRHQAIVSVNRPSIDYYAGTVQGAWAVVRTFVPSGIEHILIGPDHVLFLIGLLLLGGSLSKLAAIVTAFTVGHSITLSLAALDIVSPPSNLVEPAIALSIVFVGADNLLVRRATAPRDIRAMVAAVFGLVHGFGFASVLKEFGLPPGALGWSLFSFNLGVEIGQLAIVIVVASALAAIHRRNAVLGERLALAGSIVVILAGGYWFIERVFWSGAAS